MALWLHGQVPLLTLAMMGSLVLAKGGGVDFVVQNLANSTAGGQRFDAAVGTENATAMLESAFAFINKEFYDGTTIPRKPTTQLILTIDVDNTTGGFVAYTVGGNSVNQTDIHLSDKYVGSYSGNNEDLFTEVKGILYHESTHVWQWDGQGTAPSGLIEGVADFIRLRADLAPAHWVKPGSGDSWDEGYAVTAFFLQYCESLKSGFVRDVNGKLAVSTWSLSFFQEMLGKSVDELWADYKAKYNTTASSSPSPARSTPLKSHLLHPHP